MDVDIEQWGVLLELVEANIGYDIWRHGDTKARTTNALCQRMLDTCGRHHATQPLLLLHTACTKVLEPCDLGAELNLAGKNVSPLALSAVRELLPGARQALTELLSLVLPYVQHLRSQSKLKLTADVFTDIIFCLEVVEIALSAV